MRIVIFILIVVSKTYCFGQNNAHSNKKRKASISEIRKSFPYNRTSTIKVVSFKDSTRSVTVGNEVQLREPEIPKTDGGVDLTKMFQVKTLDAEGEEKLLKVLVNYETEGVDEVVFCYEPRNGIIFLDKEDNIIGYIEICFECQRYKAEPGTITITHLYPREYDVISDIFKRAGITYGTK